MTDLKSIYERIVSTCKELGRSTNQVAAAAGKPDAIRNMRRNVEAEKEGSMNVDTIIAIAQELGVSPGWLITGEGNSGLEKRSDSGPDEATAIEGEFVVVGEDTPRLTSPAPKERTFKQQLADMRADSDEFQRAMAVVEGVVLAIGLKPEHLGEAREIIHEALESPLVLSTPDAELDVRRAMAQSNISRLLRKRKAQEDKE